MICGACRAGADIIDGSLVTIDIQQPIWAPPPTRMTRSEMGRLMHKQCKGCTCQHRARQKAA